MTQSPVMALIGCGAIAEATYLPALASHREWKNELWLVEPNPSRAQELVQRFGLDARRLVSNYQALPADVVLAINATPSHLHHAITLALVERGIHILVEKPFAETVEEARSMMEAAAAHHCLLSVNQSRRSGPANVLIRDLLRNGKIGRIKNITWSEGRPFDWPTQSGFNFRRPWKGRPRGVLLDIGVHVFDLLCWWLEGAPTVLSATMDGQGGPEASAQVQLTFGGAPIDVRLSYLAKLKNQFVIEGTAGAIRASTADFDSIEFRKGDGPWRTMRARGSADAVKNATHLIENVLEAIAGQERLWIPAASTLPALEIVDDAYARACDHLSECYVDHVTQLVSNSRLLMDAVP